MNDFKPKQTFHYRFPFNHFNTFSLCRHIKTQKWKFTTRLWPQNPKNKYIRFDFTYLAMQNFNMGFKMFLDSGPLTRTVNAMTEQMSHLRTTFCL